MDRYRATGNKIFLRKSRSIYNLAFQNNPNNPFVGMNAAVKGAMLGELDETEELLKSVERLLSDVNADSDYETSFMMAKIKPYKKLYELAIKYYKNRSTVHLMSNVCTGRRGKKRTIMGYLIHLMSTTKKSNVYSTLGH